MDKQLAEYVAHISIRSASEMSRLIPILKVHLSEEEYEPLRKAITNISKNIAENILFKIYDEYPDLDNKLDGIIEKYGRLP